MRLHRFFVEEKLTKLKGLTIKDSDLYHQLKNVFRFNVGGQVVLLDNSGYEYPALISDFGHGSVGFSIIARKESKNSPSRDLYLYVSIIKKDKFEWVVEKGTELGVKKFIPIISDRSEKKGLNYERLHKLIKESSEQSERASMPILEEPREIETVLSENFPCFAFHPKGDVFTVEHAQNFSPLGVFIGPEGGWTEREIFLFKKNGVKIYSLGGQILRAETAAIAASSVLLLS